jgi:hypothetical protein
MSAAAPSGFRPYRTFRGWLRDQRHRNDGVGDLARDCLLDPVEPRYRSLSEWSDYIGGGHAHDSLLRAWREFARVAATRPMQRRPRQLRLVKRQARSISFSLRTRILERDDFRCRRCGAGPREEKLVIDHVVPVASGGTSDESNLQTLCVPCNAGKGARLPHSHDLEGLR